MKFYSKYRFVETLLREFVLSPTANCQISDIVGALNRSSGLALDSAGAVFLLHCAVRIPQEDICQTLDRIVRLIETEYFTANAAWLDPRSPFASLLVECKLVDSSKTCFREVVHQFPTGLKALIMGYQPRRASSLKIESTWKDKVQARWNSLDPVDMEEVERDHFFKTKQVLRTSHVEAKPSRMRTGAKLAQVLGLEMLERLSDLSACDIAVMLRSLSRASRNGVFHRDLKLDAQFTICKRLLELSDEEIGKNVKDFAQALSCFEVNLEIPSRVWNRKIIPALRSGKVKIECADEWGEFAACLLTSGRVKVTKRLGEYLFPRLRENFDKLSFETCHRILDAFQVSGYLDSEFLHLLSTRCGQTPLGTLGAYVHVRNHFGLFGDTFDSACAHLNEKATGEKESLKSLPVSEQLLLLNCMHASAEMVTSSGIFEDVFKALPDLDIETVGRIDSVIE